MLCSCTSSLCIVLHRSLLDVWCGILFLTYFHDSSLIWHGIVYVMYLSSWFIMLWFEIPLFYVDGILMLSSWIFSLRSLLCHVGRMLIMLEFVPYNKRILTESSYSGTSLGATPTWSCFPCMIATFYVHHNYWQHLKQQTTPSWHWGPEM